MIEMQGNIKRIIFESQENGYVVAEFLQKNQKVPIIITGEMLRVRNNAYLEIKGDWVVHQKYGQQFKASSIKPIRPDTCEGLVEYLSSGLISGIGPAIAQRIVAHFGDSAIEVVTKNPEKLIEIKGIGKKKCEKIVEEVLNNDELSAADIFSFLQSYDISVNLAGKIHRKYGNEAIEIIKENPYIIALEFPEIEFEDVDRVAHAMGFPADSSIRIKEGICHTILKHIRKGHIYYAKNILVKEVTEKLNIEDDIVIENLELLEKDGRIVIDDECVYLEPYYIAEVQIAENLQRVVLGKPNIKRKNNINKAISQAEKILNLTFESKQKEAVKKSLCEKIVVITGGPGTGKTTIIKAILESLKISGTRVMLAAPTGRAAKRMEQVTGYEAQTLHRLLEYSMEYGCFQRDKDNPLDIDFLIVDEASMIDMFLMLALTDALPPGISLVLVGDVDQLPPVGPGSVLNDIISSGTVPVISLYQIFRQAQKSNIITNSHLINSGKLPILKNHQDSNFFFLSEKNPLNIDSTIADLVARRIPDRYNYNPKTDIQVLAPMKKGSGGVYSLNKVLQEKLNPAISEASSFRNFRPGDKVMHIRNNYDLDVYNGDIGYIKLCDRENGLIRVVYDQEKQVDYRGMDINDLVLAYASSIHKSQGSEYPVVIISLMSHHHVLLQKKLIYTAVTRGKELVIIVGEPEALSVAISTSEHEQRNTGLSKRMKDFLDVVADRLSCFTINQEESMFVNQPLFV